MGLNYIPPPIIYQAEEHRTSFGKPYFYECQGRIINLAAATQFYVDHMPLTSYYWPCVKVGGNSYHLTAAMSTKEDAMKFLRDLTTKIEGAANAP
jgi:hypothetical protein